MSNLSFAIKKTDLVKTNCGFIGHITKYSSNKEITVTPTEDYAESIGKVCFPTLFSKEQIIEVNGILVIQIHKEKVVNTTNKVIEKSLGSEFIGYNLKLGSKGWVLTFNNEEKHSTKTALEMAKFLKANDLKNLPCSSKLPKDVKDLIFKNVSKFDRFGVEG